MSKFIKFYFTSYVLNLFRTLTHPSTGACGFLLYHHIGCVFLFRFVLEFRCGWVGVVSCGRLQNLARTQHNSHARQRFRIVDCGVDSPSYFTAFEERVIFIYVFVV